MKTTVKLLRGRDADAGIAAMRASSVVDGISAMPSLVPSLSQDQQRNQDLRSSDSSTEQMDAA